MDEKGEGAEHDKVKLLSHPVAHLFASSGAEVLWIFHHPYIIISLCLNKVGRIVMWYVWYF